MFKIGGIEIKNGIVLAPMAGYTDYAFRKIAHDYGCGLTVTEMVNIEGLIRSQEKTLALTYNGVECGPSALQIFGSNVESYIEAVKEYIDKSNFDIVDINMGCPMPKITKNGNGSALLKDIDKIYDIVYNVKKNSKKPISVKIRIGIDEKSINGIEVSKVIERAGADAITVHGRTAKMLYSGEANWDYIKKIVKSTNIPIIANGDVDSYEAYRCILEKTGAAGVAIGRAALGNPFIFKEIDKKIHKEEYKIEDYEYIDAAIVHMKLLSKIYDKNSVQRNMKKQIIKYIKGLRGASNIKMKICESNDFDESLNILYEYKNKIKEEV